MSTLSLSVLAPAFYPSTYSTRYLVSSAARQGITVQLYGLGQPYRGWLDVQIHSLRMELDRVRTTHVMYVDGSDTILLSPLREIVDKYVADLGEPPILASVERDGMNAGGILAEVGALKAALDVLAEVGTFDWADADSNPQTRWREAIAKGYVDVVFDSKSEIFQVTGNGPLDVVPDIGQGRVYNSATETWPCVLHFAGGYSDPQTGKSDQIDPIWSALGWAKPYVDERMGG